MGKNRILTDYKDEKVTEKQFLRVLITLVWGIMLCMTCLVGTTWAWFSLSVSSSDNTIQVGEFNADIAVYPNTQDQSVTTAENNTYYLAPGEYTIRIESRAQSTASGYCVVILDGTEYKTDCIYPNADGISFSVTISEPPPTETDDAVNLQSYVSTLTFLPVWGSPVSDSELLCDGRNIVSTAKLPTVDATVSSELGTKTTEESTVVREETGGTEATMATEETTDTTVTETET